ncbi:unnamed protein product, partial [Closterium sp. NIES-54]
MADRKEGHAGGLDCGSRARRSDEGSSSDSSSSYGSSHGSLTVANDTSITATAAVVAAAAAAESTATEFAVTAITSAADSETEALLSFGASSSDPSTPRDDFSSTPSESPSPSPPSPQFAVSDAAQPWSRTGGAMALDAARLIQQVGMQQLMRRRQSPRRASAPEQLPDPQPSTWAYSRPVVILDAFWNLAFVVVTAITLFISQARNERPPAPLSIWLLGYAVQCAVHVICVLLEHERRESRRVREQREQRRGGRRARRRGRAGRRARDGRIDRGRERGGELERGSGGATGGNGSVNGETGGGGGAEGTEFDVPLNQSGELGGIRGSGDWGGNAEGTGSRREGEGEEEFISILRRRDAGRAVTLDEAASVLITGRDLVVDREEREGEALEGLLGAERAGGEDGRGDAQARRVGRMVGEEGATVADEEMMVGAVDEGESGDSDQSLARRVESANTMFSFAWWLVGFTWILSTIDDSFKDAPILSWATTAFLAFDVFFVVFCVAVACVVGMAVCCCLPCIIALIYAVADQEGATREQIEALPKFKFYRHRTAANSSSQASSICPFHSFSSSSFRLSSSPPLSSSTSFSSSPAVRTAPCPCCSSSAFAGAMWRNAVGLAAGLWRRAGRAGGNNSSGRNIPSGDALD